MSVAAAGRALHVLVIDDSAVARQGMAAVLGRHPGVTVSTLADAVSALEWMRSRRPDVVVLDLEMPRMHGLDFLRRVMRERPVPVVVCSGVTARGTRAALQALEEGAVEVVAKDSVRFAAPAPDDPLTRAVLAAAHAAPALLSPGAVAPPLRPFPAWGGAGRVVAVGASTGGPQALRTLLAALPAEAPPMVIVQHMPREFTAALARGLHAASRMEVREATAGDALRPGLALVAPGGRHLRVVRDSPGGGLRVALSASAPVQHHRPSVDVLFHSVAAAAGAGAVGVLLTGMGADGADGLLAMRRAGAQTLVQDEATSVVWGMPREALERGAAGRVLPLSALPSAILHAAAAPAVS